MLVSSGLGLGLIAAGVILATLTRVPLWWVPLACGTLCFGIGLALVPRVRRLKTQVMWVERRAQVMAHDLRSRQVARLVNP